MVWPQGVKRKSFYRIKLLKPGVAVVTGNYVRANEERPAEAEDDFAAKLTVK